MNGTRQTAQEFLAELNKLDEHIRLEAKSGAGDSALETICAFANEPGLGGGTILIGVKRLPDTLFPVYEAIGLREPDAVGAELASQCAQVFNLPIRPTIRTEDVGGKPVLLVEVQELSPAEKPLYFKRKGLPRGAYRRVGSTDQHCNEDDLAALFGGRGIETFDAHTLPGARMEDLDPDAIEHYRRLRQRVNPGAEELQWSDLELLEALSAVRRDGQALQPTLAGVLLFGTRQALRRLLPSVRVDYIRVPGREWIDDPEQRFTTVDMRGPLLQLVQRVQDQVFEDLPKPFALEEGQAQARRESVPARVLREAIVNAVMHASYRVHEPVQVIRYSNRLEIRNPGYSLKNAEQLGQPGSRLRNPKLAAVFHDTNLAETKGSGIRTMQRLMENAGFAPPTFDSSREDDSFTARLLLHHFFAADDLAWLASFDDLALNDAQRRALVFVRESGAIDNQTYRQINGLDTLAASRDLRRLRDLDVLEMNERGVATYYTAGPRLRAAGLSGGATSKARPTTVSETGETHQLLTKTHQLSPETHQLPSETHQLRAENTPALPEELQKHIAAIKGKRLPISRTSNLIEAICKVAPFTAEQLASLLGRKDPKHFRRVYLTPLINEHRLVYTIPDMPNHPHQAYRAAVCGQNAGYRHE